VKKDSESNNHVCKTNKGKDVLLVSDSTTGEVMCSSCGEVISQNEAELGPESVQTGEDYMSKSRTGRKSTLRQGCNRQKFEWRDEANILSFTNVGQEQ
jgi:transcription initiation factor TFIIIB Brf1 subunit/transcription initiation factor TFIIB